MIAFRCYRNYATVGHIGMQIVNFVVLSVIIGTHNVLFPHIRKTHWPIVLLNVHEPRFELMLKRAIKETN